MSFNIKTGVGPLSFGVSKAFSGIAPISTKSSVTVGKVMGVVTTKNTPTSKQFEKVGGYSGMGTVFFINYDNAKRVDPQNSDSLLDICDTAKPLFPNLTHYPLLGELVYVIEGLPSPSSQNSPGVIQKYYISVINLWGNIQQNAQTFDPNAPLGKYFIENALVKNLLNYEGDYIIQGRKGNSLRFGSTSRAIGDLNEWSTLGENGNPITILSNGHSYDKTKDYYIEQINKDASSIYLTTNQSIPLTVSVKEPINPITSPIRIPNYLNSQAIINADRVIINSKKDEVMLFSPTSVEISSNNYVNLNAGKTIYLNIKEENPATSTGPAPKIILGTRFDNTAASEPVLLGEKTSVFLLRLVSALDAFALSLTATSTNSEGSPLAKVQGAAEGLQTQLNLLYKQIQPLKSNSTFTI
jgi:hypothetical protein